MPDERANIFVPCLGFTLGPKPLRIPCERSFGGPPALILQSFKPIGASDFVVPSGNTQRADRRPHVRALPIAPAVAVRQMPIAFAAAVASPFSARPSSHAAASSSGVPLQSSSIMFPGTSKAPGLVLGSQSLQSPFAD